MSTRTLTAGDYGIRPWSAFFKEDGGSKDLNVNGSSASVQFKIHAIEYKYLHIQCVKLQILSSNLNVDSKDLWRFGSVGGKNGEPLENGLLMNTDQQGEEGTIFAEPVTTLQELLLYCEGVDNLCNVDGKNDLLIAKIPFWAPITLVTSTEGGDCLTLTIQDDMRELDSFQVMAYGFTEHKK